MTRERWDFSEILMGTRDWLNDPEQIRMGRDQPRKLIEERGLAGSDCECEMALGPMWFLGHWYSNAAIVQIVDAHPTGWSTMRRGLHWQYWSIRFAIEFRIKKNPNRKSYPGGVDPLQLAHWLSHACATRDDEIADWLGRLMVRSLDRGLVDEFYQPYDVFVLHLYLLWRGLELDLRRYRLPWVGPYQELLDTWDDGNRLRPALLKACDYHCERIYDPTDEEDGPEFSEYPYIIFPTDILAIRRVRDDLQLNTPTIEHPLLATPLAFPPAEPPAFEDTLLSEVVQRLRSQLAS